ncbi:MAG: hypothetical protein GY834_13855 [Bacteroidetes bacterium]|nr:hypothetical protein [Bacteroidota bacterium]
MEVKFKDFSEDVKREIQTVVAIAVFNTADAVLKTAKATCPVEKYSNKAKNRFKQFQNRKPGSLKNSGRIVKWKNADALGAYVKFGGRGYMVNGIDTYYAPFVELGTPGTITRYGKKRTAIKAKSFLRDSLKTHRKSMLKFKKV